MDASITRESIADVPARNPNSQTSTVGADGYPGFDNGGHLLSRANGGAGERINMIPLEALLNQGQRGDWRAMEDMITREARAGREVSMRMRLVYGANERPNRPTEIEVDVYIDGNRHDDFAFENLRP